MGMRGVVRGGGGGGAVSSRSTAVRVVCLRKWKRPQLGANGRYVKQPMHVVVGDTVQVVAGSDKGKVTEVTAVRPETSEVCCRGVRVVTKHQKPQSEGESGQIVRFETWLHSSNVMHYSKEEKVRSRVGTRCVCDCDPRCVVFAFALCSKKKKESSALTSRKI